MGCLVRVFSQKNICYKSSALQLLMSPCSFLLIPVGLMKTEQHHEADEHRPRGPRQTVTWSQQGFGPEIIVDIHQWKPSSI